MKPYISDSDMTLYQGDCLEVLRTLPDASVDMIATSPPFYGLRDYGVEGQIGLEETPDEWVAHLVAVFRECHRVLAQHGTLWVEVGDSYASQGGPEPAQTKWQVDGASNTQNAGRSRTPGIYKPKDLIGQPWMLAFALRADGWYLRSEIIWSRPNPMPESVRDRPTKAHSTVFLLSKQSRYFYDADAIREQFSENTHSRGKGIGVKAELEQESGTLRAGRNNASFQRATQTNLSALSRPPQLETLDGSEGEAPRGPDGRRVTTVKGQENSEQHRDGERWPNPSGANARSVWTIATEPTSFAHYATWPTALIKRMILAGTSEHGKCPECGAPWTRDVATPFVGNLRTQDNRDGHADLEQGITRNDFGGSSRWKQIRDSRRMLGWLPSCDHDFDPVPCVVLDPFGGSGTTGLVARHLGRHSILIELNEKYCKLAAERLQQLSLLA